MTFGEFLNKKRIEKNITVRKFASLVGVSPSFLCDLENGSRAFPAKSRNNPELLQRIVEVLELDEQEQKVLKNYAEETMLLGNRIPNEISEYLQQVPEAQQALRLAKEKSISKEQWEMFVKMIEEK